MIGETVFVLRPAVATDEYGDETPGVDVARAYSGVAVAPRYSTEDNDSRSAVIVGLTLYFRAGADITATDRLRVRGAVYAVVGQPGSWINPFTSVNRGLEVAATLHTG